MNPRPRVRIAPSPTGPIHVGTLHTALFNWLFARNQGGDFILRLEDTDQERSRSEWVQHIYQELKWLGIEWDEGPDVGGPHAPYAQMERLSIYGEYTDRLLAEGLAYQCYCTPEEIEAERNEATRAGIAYRYSRKCLGRTEQEIEQLQAEGRKPCIRLKVPDSGQIVIDDLIRGRIEIAAETIGDPVIMRPNGIPLYNFAVVVDDVHMGITHVIRGEEHISNTPIQLLIAQALKVTPPQYAHLGLLLNPDRTKMSKRRGDAFAGWYRENGYLPEALLNFLALLGWAPADGKELLTPAELIAEFSLDRVAKAGAILDRQKLDWMNGQYIRRLTLPDLAKRAVPFLAERGIIDAGNAPLEKLERIMAIIQERIVTLLDIPDQVAFFFGEVQADPELAGQWFTPENLEGLQAIRNELAKLESFDTADVEQVCRRIAQEKGFKPKQLFQAIRLAVTGRLVSPPLFESMAILGQSRTVQLLDACLKERV